MTALVPAALLQHLPGVRSLDGDPGGGVLLQKAGCLPSEPQAKRHFSGWHLPLCSLPPLVNVRSVFSFS